MQASTYSFLKPQIKISNSYSKNINKLQAFVQTVQQWEQNYRTRKALCQLTAEQLKDVGLSKEQAIDEVNKPFWM